MKKKIEIKKKIEFSSMIGEVCAISLENDLKFMDEENIEGNFALSGRYKSTAASLIEEDFHYEIPVSISLTEKVNPDSGKIAISDFYYDVVDGNSVLCNIELELEAEDLLEERECDGDPIEEKEIEIPHIENPIDADVVEEEISVPDEREESSKVVENVEKVEAVEALEEKDTVEDNECFFNLDSSKETYGTFIVYIVRQNETINSIIEKYQTSVEEIEKYNDIKDLSIGSKIIIPITNEKDT